MLHRANVRSGLPAASGAPTRAPSSSPAALHPLGLAAAVLWARNLLLSGRLLAALHCPRMSSHSYNHTQVLLATIGNRCLLKQSSSTPDRFLKTSKR